MRLLHYAGVRAGEPVLPGAGNVFCKITRKEGKTLKIEMKSLNLLDLVGECSKSIKRFLRTGGYDGIREM